MHFLIFVPATTNQKTRSMIHTSGTLDVVKLAEAAGSVILGFLLSVFPFSPPVVLHQEVYALHHLVECPVAAAGTPSQYLTALSSLET